MTASDTELLQQFARDRSEEAFTVLVKRHIDLVYSAALRQVRFPQLAEEVTQTVFVDLSRNAQKIKADSILTAWLYSVTRRTAIDVIRSESRRQLREQIAMELSDMNSPDAPWSAIEPLLDEAMEALEETDRTSLLLRYFENKSLDEVGKVLGISDDAAQKRVSRAVERLREFLAKRGVATGASGLAIVLSAHAVQAAPVSLAVSISAAAGLVGTAVQTSTTIAATKTITMTTLQKCLVTTTLVAAVSAGIYETHQASTAQTELRTLQQEQRGNAAQIEQLNRERNDAKARIEALQQENERLRQTIADAPKLRGEVARLKTAQQQLAQAKASVPGANDPSMKLFLESKAKAEKIARYMEQVPDKMIPELKLLTDVDWLSATKHDLETEEDLRQTLSLMRSTAKGHLPLAGALQAFVHENNGRLPGEMAELKSYLRSQLGEKSLDDETIDGILGRYKLLHTGNVSDLPQDAWIIVEKAPVDKEHDSRAKFGLGRTTVISTGLNQAGDPEDATY